MMKYIIYLTVTLLALSFSACGVSGDSSDSVTSKVNSSTFEEISNLKVTNITEHSCKVTWEGSESVKTWLYIHELKTIGTKHDAVNSYTYSSLGSGYTFTVFAQGVESGKTQEAIFSTPTSKTSAVAATVVPSIVQEYTSPYLEKIDIPEYDSNNDEHVLITPTNGNWFNSVLNDSSKTHFYIQAGDYSANRITLTSSGTSNNRRTITLYDPNDPTSQVHPSKLNISEQANISLEFDGASYWTVSRVSNINDTYRGSFFLVNQSTDNILDRLHIKNYNYGIIIRPFCNNNTIQSSYLDYMTHTGRISDNVGIAITTVTQHNITTSNTKIINNDIKNANDGIQIVRGSEVSTGSFPGTIIDDNRIWVDGDIYTNGDYSTNGYSQDGEYMIGENAIDLKVGSDDIDNPVIVTNNVMHGYRHGDATAGGTVDASYGVAFVAHLNTKNVVFQNNIIYNSERAFALADPGVHSIYSGQNWNIQNNIFASINLINPENAVTFGVIVYKAKNIIVENNIFSNIIPNSKNEGAFFRYGDIFTGCTFKNNTALNSYGTSSPNHHDDPTKDDSVSIVDIDNNYFYNSPESMDGLNTHIVFSIDDLNIDNHVTFENKKIAVTETKTLIFSQE